MMQKCLLNALLRSGLNRILFFFDPDESSVEWPASWIRTFSCAESRIGIMKTEKLKNLHVFIVLNFALKLFEFIFSIEFGDFSKSFILLWNLHLGMEIKTWYNDTPGGMVTIYWSFAVIGFLIDELWLVGKTIALIWLAKRAI